MDTSSNTWTNPSTGAQVYQPGYNCIGLPPAYRTSDPTPTGECSAGYKLGKIERDASGNITKINYADGSTGDAVGNYTPPSTQTQSTSQQNTTSPNPNAFCAGGSCTYTPLEPLPGMPSTFGGKNSNDSFASLAGGSIKLFIWLGAIVAVVMIILGALTYMFSDIVPNKKRAIDRIRGAMWGLLLLAASWLILNTINPQLTTFNLNINPAAPVTSGSVTSPVPTGLTPAARDACIAATNANKYCTITAANTCSCTTIQAPTDL